MDFKVATVLAMMVVSCLSAPEAKAWSWASKCPCPKIFVPLCASDGNVYNNICEFECHAKRFQTAYGVQLQIIDNESCTKLIESKYV